MASKKVYLLSLPIILFALAAIPQASADGMVHYWHENRWILDNENRQTAFINYDDGFERMIISIGFDQLHGEKAVWLFPVPATPEKTVISIVDELPKLSGSDVRQSAKNAVTEMFSFMLLSQVYTSPFSLLFFFGRSLGSTFSANGYDVAIYEHIEKYGVTTELVTAKSGDSFYGYLRSKGLDLPNESIDILSSYIGKDYCFVVTWVSDVGKFNQESMTPTTGEYLTYRGQSRPLPTLGVQVYFPTDRMYFPLKPTSVYESQEIPITLYVIGHVTPDVYTMIKQTTKVSYFTQNYYKPSSALESFFNGKTYTYGSTGKLRYTMIKIDSPSKYLEDDLWIDQTTPISVSLADFIANRTLLWGAFLFVLISCLSSLLAGIIVFKNDGPSRKKLVLYGLWNLLTLVGFVAASIFFKTKKIDPKLQEILVKRNLKIWDGRKIPYIAVFTVIFVVMTAIFQLIMSSIL